MIYHKQTCVYHSIYILPTGYLQICTQQQHACRQNMCHRHPCTHSTYLYTCCSHLYMFMHIYNTDTQTHSVCCSQTYTACAKCTDSSHDICISIQPYKQAHMHICRNTQHILCAHTAHITFACRHTYDTHTYRHTFDTQCSWLLNLAHCIHRQTYLCMCMCQYTYCLMSCAGVHFIHEHIACNVHT